MDNFSVYQLVTRSNNNINDCTEVTAECPASDSIYGYEPSLASCVIFIVIFGISTAVYAYQAFRYRRSWLAFSIVLSIGCIAEAIGYIGRLMLNSNPFSNLGFKLSVVLLTFAPAFMTGGIYLLLKHICLTLGPGLSRLRPKFYTWIFVSCDIVSILLQAAGGALSAIATGQSLLNIGVDVMIAGLAFQVFTLFVFGLLAGDFWLRVLKNKNSLSGHGLMLLQNKMFRLFIAAATTAYLCVFTRCCYRVAELSGGWGNSIMRQQAEFIVLDSVMIGVTALLFNVFHPGFCFQKADNQVEHEMPIMSDESHYTATPKQSSLG